MTDIYTTEMVKQRNITGAKCDLCGAVSDSETRVGSFRYGDDLNIFSCTMRIYTGIDIHEASDCDYDYDVDICPKCFKEKLGLDLLGNSVRALR